MLVEFGFGFGVAFGFAFAFAFALPPPLKTPLLFFARTAPLSEPKSSQNFLHPLSCPSNLASPLLPLSPYFLSFYFLFYSPLTTTDHHLRLSIILLDTVQFKHSRHELQSGAILFPSHFPPPPPPPSTRLDLAGPKETALTLQRRVSLIATATKQPAKACVYPSLSIYLSDVSESFFQFKFLFIPILLTQISHLRDGLFRLPISPHLS